MTGARADAGTDRRARLARLLHRGDWLLRNGVEALAIALLCVYASLCFYQVIARFLIDMPASWTEALTRTLMIWSVYLGALALFREGLLISVDFLYGISRGRFRRTLEVLHVAAALAVLGAACYFGFQLAWRVRHQVLAGVEISMGWAYLAVPVGALLCMIGLIARFCDRSSDPAPTLPD
ncbi:MAG: TRAP transporter small permease [Salinarimonadaceae bacterium]|nr:MAG: TRAP transporter small permease [Salinarimonadaceae bacterium]